MADWEKLLKLLFARINDGTIDRENINPIDVAVVLNTNMNYAGAILRLGERKGLLERVSRSKWRVI